MSSSCLLISESLSPEGDDMIRGAQGAAHFKRKSMLKQFKMINIIKSGFKYKSNLNFFSVLVLLTIISQFTPIARCQDFEDLKNNRNNNNNINNRQSPNNGANLQQMPQAFQPSRQPMQAASLPPSNTLQQQQRDQAQHQQHSQPASARQSSFQRPMLSNRFAPANMNQHLGGQLTSSNVGPVLAENGQSSLNTAASQPASSVASPPSGAGGSTSNIEQIMKNALARSAKLEATSIEARQDGPSEQPAIQSRPAAQAQVTAAAAPASGSAPSSGNANSGASSSVSSTASLKERAADPSESSAGSQAADESEKQTTTTTANQATAAHETVYSDQRFASLFARRGAGKKSKFTPTEQVKAKPTLPSFIKSPPDPKQFTLNPVDGQDRPIIQVSGNLVSARSQQQQSNQNRLNSVANQQKKNGSTAANNNAALIANNNKKSSPSKPAPVSNAATNTARVPNSSSSSKANGQSAASSSGGATSKPATSNNPFNRSQVNGSDQANVIAMARRRLLANNALQQKQAN